MFNVSYSIDSAYLTHFLKSLGELGETIRGELGPIPGVHGIPFPELFSEFLTAGDPLVTDGNATQQGLLDLVEGVKPEVECSKFALDEATESTS